jgi:hypothetical protein
LRFGQSTKGSIEVNGFANSASSPRPLDGLLVASIEQALAAPLCTGRLAEMGARVVKIERAARLRTRRLCLAWRQVVHRLSLDPGPAVLDVVTNRHELALPPKVEWAHAKGFSLYLLRAVLNGRGDEVIELTQTNLLR